MVREIPLSKGFVALVDDDDFERVNRHKWSYHDRGYGRRVITVDGTQYNVFLHRFILGAPDGVEIDHINHDGLDCQKANLRYASRRQNAWNVDPSAVKRNGQTWRFTFTHDGRRLPVPGFDTEAEATAVRDALIRRLRGDFGAVLAAAPDAWADEVAGRLIAGERFPRRISRHRAVITESDVVAIRTRYCESVVTMKVLAAEYGITQANVSHIVTGRTWSDVGGPISHRRDRDTTNYAIANRAAVSKLTDTQVRTIRERYAAGGTTHGRLADEFGVGLSTIQHICQGRSFRDVGGPVTGFRENAKDAA